MERPLKVGDHKVQSKVCALPVEDPVPSGVGFVDIPSSVRRKTIIFGTNPYP